MTFSYEWRIKCRKTLAQQPVGGVPILTPASPLRVRPAERRAMRVCLFAAFPGRFQVPLLSKRSVELDHLANRLAAGQAIETEIDLVEPQAMGQQTVHR